MKFKKTFQLLIAFFEREVIDYEKHCGRVFTLDEMQ